MKESKDSDLSVNVNGKFKVEEGTVLVTDYGAMLIPTNGFREGYRFGLLLQGVVDTFKGKTRENVMGFLLDWMDKAGFSKKTIEGCAQIYEQLKSERVKAR